MNFREYVHPEDIPDLNALGKVLMNGETGMTHTYRMIKKDGTDFGCRIPLHKDFSSK